MLRTMAAFACPCKPSTDCTSAAARPAAARAARSRFACRLYGVLTPTAAAAATLARASVVTYVRNHQGGRRPAFYEGRDGSDGHRLDLRAGCFGCREGVFLATSLWVVNVGYAGQWPADGIGALSQGIA